MGEKCLGKSYIIAPLEPPWPGPPLGVNLVIWLYLFILAFLSDTEDNDCVEIKEQQIYKNLPPPPTFQY